LVAKPKNGIASKKNHAARLRVLGVFRWIYALGAEPISSLVVMEDPYD
jgi:hypothetical protein